MMLIRSKYIYSVTHDFLFNQLKLAFFEWHLLKNEILFDIYKEKNMYILMFMCNIHSRNADPGIGSLKYFNGIYSLVSMRIRTYTVTPNKSHLIHAFICIFIYFWLDTIRAFLIINQSKLSVGLRAARWTTLERRRCSWP